jgi:hypothetical protein
MQNKGPEKGSNVDCLLKNNYFLYSISKQFQREVSFDKCSTRFNKGIPRHEWITEVKEVQRDAEALTRKPDSLI